MIGQRAQAGARKLYQIITDKRAPDHTGSIGSIENADASSMEVAPRDTLTPDDHAGGVAGTADALKSGPEQLPVFYLAISLSLALRSYIKVLGLSAGHDDDRRNQR